MFIKYGFFREWFVWIFWKITGAQLWLFPRFFSPSVHFWQTAIQVFEVICQLATWILIRAPVYINIICWKFTLKPDCLQYIIFESLPQSCCFHAIQQSMDNYIIPIPRQSPNLLDSFTVSFHLNSQDLLVNSPL